MPLRLFFAAGGDEACVTVAPELRETFMIVMATTASGLFSDAR
jgi:hypothetical protein